MGKEETYQTKNICSTVKVTHISLHYITNNPLMRKNIKINEHKPLVNIFCLMLMSQLPSQGNSRTQGRRVIPRPFPQLHIHTHTHFFMHELFSSLLLPTVNSVRTHLYLMFFLYCLVYKRARM